jgi:hypothetical protein
LKAHLTKTVTPCQQPQGISLLKKARAEIAENEKRIVELQTRNLKPSLRAKGQKSKVVKRVLSGCEQQQQLHYVHII